MTSAMNADATAGRRVVHFFSRRLTPREDRSVRIPSPRIPAWKLKWSAITPMIKGAPHMPNATPIERAIPVTRERSERSVSFEMAAKPTGKKETAKVA